MLCVARYDKPDGGKEILPRSYIRDEHGNESWQWKAPPEPKPLYRLDRLAKAAPDTLILVVEGEKAADAAQRLFPEFVVMTWPGGANAVNKADWSPLKDREVSIWPDNDEPGRKAAKDIQAILPNAEILRLPSWLPKGWDLADSLPLGLDYEYLFSEISTVHGPMIRNVKDWLQEPLPPRTPIIDNVFDVGDKVFTIGLSKARKSFFMLQAALSIAAGKDFFGFRVPCARRVALMQFEIRSDHYQKRIQKMSTAMGLDPSDFADRLLIGNCRGQGVTLDNIETYIGDFNPDLIIIDPFYKLYGQGHDENSAGDAADLMAKVDELAEKSGAAVWIVHHDTKAGGANLRNTSRGSGSGLIARDYDASLILTPHADNDDVLVVASVLRNYAPQDDFCIRWDNDLFTVAEDILPKVETPATIKANNQRGPSDEDIIKIVAGWFNGTPLGSTSLQSRIREHFNIGQRWAERIVRLMAESGQYKRYKNPDNKKVEIIPLSTPHSASC